MEVRKFNDGGTAGDWGYQDGIMFKAIMDVYNEYNSPSCDMSALLNYANTYYNTKVQANGTINSGYIANELDDKEPAEAP